MTSPRMPLWGILAAAAFACAPAPGTAPQAPQPIGSILASSSPAAGVTVAGPVDELVLHFNPPARLLEVTVNGPDGAMPTMVTAVGETAHYSLPMPGLTAGTYSVSWRASAQGREHRGLFRFSIR